ncbi:type II secretion system F family protein [Jannaschia aquimarina]|uniref:Bacterial type II secretion system protein F domain protein n=1 Tax=Jannaschia aquimarina TaxID=935700 RepID=A0A0D1EI10_9RHOB|nr:type II secretion system F family protein [Jannaschia aquimarina]KIT16531.1 Bacterial type II secretion system protein F domain protein [Jannaschia aquimarina]SNT06366.1 tight adherence protein B [Jannaschia aquimarina]
MQLSIEPLIYLAIFGAVYLLIGGIYLLIFGKSIKLNNRVNRRLTLMEKGNTRDQVMAQLRKEMSQHDKAKSIPLYSLLAEKAQKANLAFTPGMLIGVMALLTVVSFFLLSFFTTANSAMLGVLSIVFGVGSVFVWVNRAAKKRLSLMEEQLPDAIELIVRSLRVGHPLNSAIGIVAKEVADPLGSEMGFIADEAAYGRDVSESLRALAERTGLQDMRFLAVAVAIQQKSGGNLAEILEGLSNVVRARFKLFRKVKAITAEARWSGIFLSAFPILALVGINVMQPDYYDDVKDSTWFIPMAAIVVVFLIVNVFFMRMMVNIKV